MIKVIARHERVILQRWVWEVLEKQIDQSMIQIVSHFSSDGDIQLRPANIYSGSRCHDCVRLEKVKLAK